MFSGFLSPIGHHTQQFFCPFLFRLTVFSRESRYPPPYPPPIFSISTLPLPRAEQKKGGRVVRTATVSALASLFFPEGGSGFDGWMDGPGFSSSPPARGGGVSTLCVWAAAAVGARVGQKGERDNKSGSIERERGWEGMFSIPAFTPMKTGLGAEKGVFFFSVLFFLFFFWV